MSKYPLTYKPVEATETIRLSRKRIGDDIFQKIEEISGENVFGCMQCGRCSAGCPMHGEMDLAPNQIWKLLQMGEYERVKSSNAIWMCAACFTCMVRCPKGVDLSKAIEAVRQVLLRKRLDHVNPSSLPRETLRGVPQIALISCLKKFSS